MSSSNDDGSVEDKAARALAAAHAFLARSPVPKRAGGDKATTTKTSGKDVVDGLKRVRGAAGGDDALKTTTAAAATTTTTTTTLERSASSTATSAATSASRSDVRTRLEKEFDDATGRKENANALDEERSAATTTSKTTASTASTNDRVENRAETDDGTGLGAEEAVTSPERVVVDTNGTKDGWTTSENKQNDVADGEEREMTTEELEPEPTLGEPPNRRSKAPPTPASVVLELSESEGESSAAEDSDGEVVESPVTFTRVIDVVDEVEEAEHSESEGVFAVAIEREREARETTSSMMPTPSGETAAKDMEISSLKEEIERLNAELESMRWGREALETRAVEAERAVAELQANKIEKALDPQNQLTNEQVAALRAEIEQVEYLKRLLARAEQMRNAARAETKQARDKHERDLEIVRKEVAAMDEEMMNLRQRVKTDKTKIETLERTTIEAADEFATLYSRQENTRRLLMVCVVVIIALAVRLGLNGQTVTLKNMYQY